MAITDSIDLSGIIPWLNELTVFGMQWPISAVLIIIICAAITRDKEKWKILALPISVCLFLIGIKTSIVVVTIAALSFVQEMFSLNILEDLILTRDFRDAFKSSRTNMLSYRIKRTSETLGGAIKSIFTGARARRNIIPKQEETPEWDSLKEKWNIK